MLKPKRRIRREIEETGGEIETGTGVTVETEIEVCGACLLFFVFSASCFIQCILFSEENSFRTIKITLFLE